MKILIIRAASFVCALLTALMIFSFSAETGEESGDLSGKITETILSAVAITRENTPTEEYAAITEKMHFAVRKLAHFSEYCMLGFFLCVFFHTFDLRSFVPGLFAFGISVVYASLDEWHQSFIPGRGPGLGDVMIDAAGALFGVLIVFFAARRLKRRK